MDNPEHIRREQQAVEGYLARLDVEIRRATAERDRLVMELVGNDGAVPSRPIAAR